MKRTFFVLAGLLITLLVPRDMGAQTVACPYPVANETPCNVAGTVTFFYFNGMAVVPCGTAVPFYGKQRRSTRPGSL